jgi:hypothetical protein
MLWSMHERVSYLEMLLQVSVTVEMIVEAPVSTAPVFVQRNTQAPSAD